MTYLRIAVYYYSRMLRKNVDIHHNSPRILIVHYLRNHSMYLQPIITQYFIDNKSEIWLLFLIAHSKR